MRKITVGIFTLFITLSMMSSCSDSKDVDTEKPIIDLTADDAFPQNGDTLYFGETFTIKVHFSDNVKLGSYSLDIHNNFDHHSHSTEVTEVYLDPIKTAVNPYTLIKDCSIPRGYQTYDTELKITLPESDKEGDFDDGDYHFMIQLADKEGWSSNVGLSIKILHRK